MAIKQKLFSAISWRVESRAGAMTPAGGARLRNRAGHLMRWAGAHRTLPDICNRAAILCFHGVTDRRIDREVESAELDRRDFCRLLDVLGRAFNVIPLAELVQAIRDGSTLPPRSMVITFDDGYANNATVAAEELAVRKMDWSAFLPPALIEHQSWQWIDEVRILIHRGSQRRLRFHWDGQDIEFDLHTSAGKSEAMQRIHEFCRYVPESIRQARMQELYDCYGPDELADLKAVFPSLAPMTWEQARQLKAAGVDVGSHSLNHIALSQQPTEQIRHEILAARELLQQRIGEHSPHFSYPYGRPEAISDATEAVLAEVGYHCGLTLEQNVIDCTGTNLLQLPRIIVSTDIGRVLFGLWQRFIR